jgi:hypothetical protein
LDLGLFQCSAIASIDALEREAYKDTTDAHGNKEQLDGDETVTNDTDSCNNEWDKC